MNAPLFASNAESGAPGSARFQRVGFGILPKRTFRSVWSNWMRLLHSTRQEVRDGGTPSPSHGTCALPGTAIAPRAFLAALALAACAPAFTHAADLDKDDPAAELASFKLPPGFEANLFASEADGVVKPIQMRWDTRGRLWVIQSTTYPQLVPGETPNDKVLILEDTDGDGRADKTTVFADGLMIPTGLEIAPTDLGAKRSRAPLAPESGSSQEAGRAGALGSEGEERAGALPSACYVGEGTKLWLLTDTDGDGKCDKREVALRGFGTGDNHQNINSFRWSPGGELMFSQGLHAHSRVETPHGIVALDEAGFFRYRPREQRLDAFYGGQSEPQNPWGFVFTDWGQMLMVAGNNGGIYWPLPEMIRGVQKGRREQIWEKARGRKCSGPDIIGTAHFPPEWQGVMLSGGYINNSVWALDIHDDGAGFKITDREPLIRSTHGSFRPVDVKLGPDGAIYICDWYNPIIGHYQASFRHPDRDKAHGRIWRVTYKGRPLVKPPQIAGATVEALLENLKSPERWVREQSKRELAGRPTEEVVKVARAWWPKVGKSGVPPDATGLDPTPAGQAGRLTSERTLVEALGVFAAHETPEYDLLRKLDDAKNPDARAYLAGLVARWADRHDGGLKFLPIFATDEDLRARVAAIVAAGNLPSIESVGVVILALFDEPSDKSIRLAVRSALTALQPQVDALNRDPSAWEAFAKCPGYQDSWRKVLAELQRPPGSPKPATSPAPTAVKISPTIPATGKLRAAPEFVAALAAEVRAHGNAAQGAEVYRRAELACTACHSLEDKGGKIGPPLDAIGSGQPLDFIIGATLEPQREIKESYEAAELTAKDGRKLAGYIVARDATGVTLRDPGTGAETKLAPADVAGEKQLGSFMPAGLVDALSRADLRDLFRYLSELGKPK